MTCKEAAALIGCSVNQVRHLIRTKRLQATRENNVPYGYIYQVPREEAERYRDTQQSKGYPRGAKRTKCRGPVQNDETS